MTFIKSFGLLLFGLLFSLSLFMTASFFTIDQFTQYNNSKGFFIGIIGDKLSASVPNGTLPYMREAMIKECENKTETVFKLGENTTEGLNNINLTCDSVKSSEDSNFSNVFAEGVFNNIYNTKLNCTYPSCFTTIKTVDFNTLSILFSSKANTFYSLMFKIFLGLSVVCVIILILLGKSWSRIAISLGTGMVVSALPLILIYVFKNKLPQQIATYLGGNIDKALSSTTNSLIIFLIIGAILLAVGIIFEDRQVKKNGTK